MPSAALLRTCNYIEAAVTDDLDILVSFDRAADQSTTGLISLAPVFSYLKSRGYEEFRNEGVVIEGWPVQFLPVASPLDAEALAHADEIEIQFENTVGAIKTRILRPEYLITIALRVGRPKDLIRMAQFLEEGAVDLKALCRLLGLHGLDERWRTFCFRTGIANPCDVG